MASATLMASVYPYVKSTRIDTERVLLRPRPYERFGGFLILLPLLPKRAPLPALPAEVWRKIMALAMEDGSGSNKDWILKESPQMETNMKLQNSSSPLWKWDLALICKDLKNVALPLLYADVKLKSLHALEKFTHLLLSSDQKWDSIRRIPYSTPGRWVQFLDVSDLEINSRSEFCQADGLLTTLFPLLPFLSRLELSLSMQLSRRAMLSLGLRDGAQNLRCLNGIKYDATTVLSGEDPLTELVACCTGLEELEVVGVGVDDIDMSRSSPEPMDKAPPLFHLSHLHTLTILATPMSPLLLRLINSPLPALQTVIITPYGDLQPPQSGISEFLAAHGESIRTLVLHTPKTWPIARYPPPRSLLYILPNLNQLSLETSGLALDAPPSSQSQKHPLTSIWISRPTSGLREELLRIISSLPNLREVRARDVRWTKRTMSASAREAGFQGEMWAWRRLLAAYKVKMLDADGLEDAEC
ncbi:hypothetical protein ACEPAG_20 [Sanghuangporus baumii]